MFAASPFAISPLGVGIESTSEGSTDPVIVDVTAGDTSAVVTYTGTATHYRLDGGASVAIGASPHTITGLTADTEYTVELTGDEITWTDAYAFGTDNSGAGGGEIPVGITGTLAATESGSDTAAITGAVLVAGILAALETGSDTAALVGQIIVRGTLAAAETGSDTASIVAAGTAPAITGSLAAVETGSDTAAAVGYVRVSGVLTAVELGADTAAIASPAARQPNSAPPSGHRYQIARRTNTQAARRPTYTGGTR